MRKMALAFILMLPLLASCSKEEAGYEGKDYIPFPLVGDFIVNVQDDSRQYVKCSITLELQDESLVADLTEKQYRVSAYITNAIGSKTAAQVKDPAERNLILAEIVSGINTEFNTKTVMRAFFTTFTTVRQ